jgi:hypothetical protein
MARSIYDAQNIIETRRRKIWTGMWQEEVGRKMGQEDEDGRKIKRLAHLRYSHSHHSDPAGVPSHLRFQ